MSILMFVASQWGDWYEAIGSQAFAAAIWVDMRRSCPEGRNADIDEHMAKCRRMIQEGEKVLVTKKPPNFDPRKLFQKPLHLYFAIAAKVLEPETVPSIATAIVDQAVSAYLESDGSTDPGA
jgi:hypothetical protein